MASIDSIIATFSASMKSIGTAVTMAGVGFYLHYREFVTKEGKRTLALMSQQVVRLILTIIKCALSHF